MLGYASPQPVDRNGYPIQSDQPTPAVALVTTISGTLLSSVITLDDRATTIEVNTTGGGAAAIKWFGSVVGNPSVTITTFDNVVPATWFRKFVIPVSVQGIGTSGSIVGGYGAQNGLYKQVAVIPLQGSGNPTSIIVQQYI